ncbi:hypothetical protein AAT19DRAFT_13225 [Rhodotorula toruloides]|uniref:Uncharacterized protein n=1 Tax=Rhodotorula toruloides TaxID=5286 RepID=A0A2T0ADY1_RHOTO|nr:hypothetical protein AAT19DRAFT_13225 [Rhodotorula toruloides]
MGGRAYGVGNGGREQERIAWLFSVYSYTRWSLVSRERRFAHLLAVSGPLARVARFGLLLLELFVRSSKPHESACEVGLFGIPHPPAALSLLLRSFTRLTHPPLSCYSHSTAPTSRYTREDPPSRAAPTPSHTLPILLTLQLGLGFDLPRTRPRPLRLIPRSLATRNGDVHGPEEGEGVLSEGASPPLCDEGARRGADEVGFGEQHFGTEQSGQDAPSSPSTPDSPPPSRRPPLTHAPSSTHTARSTHHRPGTPRSHHPPSGVTVADRPIGNPRPERSGRRRRRRRTQSPVGLPL